MQHSLDGHGSSREEARAKAEAAARAGQLDGDTSHGQAGTKKADDACDWRGDAPEPELDDLAHECEVNQQPSRPAEVCDWHDDESERGDDGLDRICESDNQPKQDCAEHKATENPEVEEGPSSAEGKQSEHDKVSENKTGQMENPADSGSSPSKGHKAVKDSPHKEHTHAPWVDSLAQMPPTVAEKVSLGMKQAIETAASILTPSTGEMSHDPVAEKGRKKSSLPPEPTPIHHPEPRPAQPIKKASKKQREKEKRKSAKQARQEARRKAKQQKHEERKQKRKEKREKARKEKARRRAIRRGGGELPTHLIQGLQNHSLGSQAPYHTRCDICARSAEKYKKRSPQCSICAKAAEREATSRYLKSSKISLAHLPSVTDLLDAIGKLLGKEKKTQDSTAESSRAQDDEDLVCHIALHIRELANDHEGAGWREHRCDDGARCSRSGRHGLDRNRDSPPTADDDQMPPNCSQNLDLSTAIATPPETDWWVQAMRSEDSQSSLIRSNSPVSVGRSVPRYITTRSHRFSKTGTKTTVYEPRAFRYPNPSTLSVPNRLDLNGAAYHFYLPFAFCHNFSCSPDPYGGSFDWSAPMFPSRPGTAFPEEHLYYRNMSVPTFGKAETLPSETIPLIQDEIRHRRSRSGSI
ncbi:hypothetical protein GGS21DRAFT_278378 [Xylaria nigripes]|nr:hypothetical protein GGS21DRAFT_278378 [Xylaria nigripes]